MATLLAWPRGPVPGMFLASRFCINPRPMRSLELLRQGQPWTLNAGDGGAADVTDSLSHTPVRRWPVPVRIALVTAVVAVTAFTLMAAGFWLYVTRPQDVRVEVYALTGPTTVLAEVQVGVDEQFVSAYAEETATVVVLHVQVRKMPGTYPAIGLMASEEIRLQAPIGDRKVRSYDGSRVREVSLERIAEGGVDEVIARWR